MKSKTTQKGYKRGDNNRNPFTTHPMKQKRRQAAEMRKEAYYDLSLRKKIAQAGRKQLLKLANCKNWRVREMAKRQLETLNG